IVPLETDHIVFDHKVIVRLGSFSSGGIQHRVTEALLLRLFQREITIHAGDANGLPSIGMCERYPYTERLASVDGLDGEFVAEGEVTGILRLGHNGEREQRE